MKRNLLSNALLIWSVKNLLIFSWFLQILNFNLEQLKFSNFCKNQLNINNFLPIQIHKTLFSKFLLIVQVSIILNVTYQTTKLAYWKQIVWNISSFGFVSVMENGASYYCVQFTVTLVILYQENFNHGWLQKIFWVEMWCNMHVSNSTFL